MEPRKVFWKKSYQIKHSPQWTISGYSRSAFRTGFYINGLDIMLDAGPQCFKKPKHIFITHSHGDHIANLPFTLIGDEEGDHVFQIYGPAEAETKLIKYIASMFEANSLSDNVPVEDWMDYHGLKPHGKPFEIVANKAKLNVEIIKCDHGIPTLSYGFGLVKKKLNPIYKGRPGKELGQLRKQGVDVTIEVVEKLLCFICDTSIQVLEDNPFVFNYSTIFIECTFLKDGEEEAATAKKHIHWQQLKPYVKQHPEITFVLFHFSLKYKDEEILALMEPEFETEGIENVDLWLSDLVDLD